MAVGTADAAAEGWRTRPLGSALPVGEPSATSLDATESRTLNWLDATKPSRFEPVARKRRGGDSLEVCIMTTLQGGGLNSMTFT